MIAVRSCICGLIAAAFAATLVIGAVSPETCSQPSEPSVLTRQLDRAFAESCPDQRHAIERAMLLGDGP